MSSKKSKHFFPIGRPPRAAFANQCGALSPARRGKRGAAHTEKARTPGGERHARGRPKKERRRKKEARAGGRFFFGEGASVASGKNWCIQGKKTMDLDRFRDIQRSAVSCSQRASKTAHCVDCCYSLYGFPPNAPLAPASATSANAVSYCLQRCDATAKDRTGEILEQLTDEIAMLADVQAAHNNISSLPCVDPITGYR